MRPVRYIFAACALAALPAVAGCSTSAEPQPTPSTSAPIAANKLVLTGPHSKGSTAVLNGQLVNESPAQVTVVGGSAYFATQLQVIQTSVQNGKPTTVAGVQLPIDANGSVVLRPNGYQIRVIGLTQALKTGTTVPLNITLANGTTMTAQAKVS